MKRYERMPEDEPLGKPVREFKDTFSVVTVLKARFFTKVTKVTKETTKE